MVLILRWFWWRVNAFSELSAMIASGVISSVLYALKLYVLKGERGWLSKQGILALTVAGSTVVWVAVTFLTAPVARDRLVAFYRRVRPYGWWGGIAAESGMPRAPGLGRMVASWLAGTVMVLAATLSVGRFLLGSPLAGCGYLAAAAVGAAVAFVAARRSRRPM